MLFYSFERERVAPTGINQLKNFFIHSYYFPAHIFFGLDQVPLVVPGMASFWGRRTSFVKDELCGIAELSSVIIQVAMPFQFEYILLIISALPLTLQQLINCFGGCTRLRCQGSS